MPQCDSSQTCTRAVRPKPSPADLLPGWAAGVSEVSRFSCMKFLGVPWGLRPRRTEWELALSLPSILPSAHVNRVGVRVVCFRGSIAHPACSVTCLWYHAGTGVSWYPSSLAVAAKTSDAVLAITGFECGGTFVHVRLAPPQEPVNKSS